MLQSSHSSTLASRPHVFSASEIRAMKNKVTSRTRIHAIQHHPLGTALEYPETSHFPGQLIAHRIAVDPLNPHDPKMSIQYSFGGVTGQTPVKKCYLLDPRYSHIEALHFKTHCEIFHNPSKKSV